ncbi:MAG: mandelate racemase/muconate lactonizing enzyme family protein [Brooklawnia sp.]|uniref:mandelate racemase/muconate lactonizing enzyme family protein n=1 Tax=Brooklawnia sp. TaxID=2699740 RepID=UPI003C7660BE
MEIEQVDVGLYKVPLDRTMKDSTHGDMSYFELITVRIADRDGVTGTGYSYGVNAGGAGIAVLIDRYLRDVLVGKDADQIEALWQQMWWCLHYAGRGGPVTSAISAVDIALWDLLGRRSGQPLWKLFGGYDPVVPVYAGGIDLELSTEELLAQSDRFQSEGFRAIKMKVGRPNPREDVTRVAAMREHLGENFPLMADANMKWTADQAIRMARALQPFDLMWLEEPVIPDDFDGQLRVVREGGLPIAAGENWHTIYEFARAISTGAVTFVEPDVCNCGGYTVFNKIAALAEANNLPLTSHGVHDLTVHSLAAAPTRTYMEAHGFAMGDYMDQQMQVCDGFVTAPDRPGHGIDLDFDLLEPHRA